MQIVHMAMPVRPDTSVARAYANYAITLIKHN